MTNTDLPHIRVQRIEFLGGSTAEVTFALHLEMPSHLMSR